MPVTAIFYAVFHPTEGTKVMHQIPSGAVVAPSKPNSSTLPGPLLDFDSIKNYVIPKPQFCNRLITFKTGAYRVIGYPVSIYGSQYARNSFNFNCCFVFPYDSDTIPYENHIRRIGKLFRTLEEQSNLLSKKIEQEDSSLFFKDEETTKKDIPDKKGSSDYIHEITNVNELIKDLNISDAITPGVKSNSIKLTSIESLIQQIFQDLNNYSECQIPIDSANSVDIKLFPIFPPPPDINSFDVPIQTVKLSSLIDINWDPTMVKIEPFINGINSVAKISKLADLEFTLTKQCIQHLMHYKCILMLDIFQFSNMYAPTSNIGLFLEDSQVSSECQAYVVTDSLFNGFYDIQSSKSNHQFDDNNSVISDKILKTTPSNMKDKIMVPSKATLFSLYRSLRYGQTLKEWSLENAESLRFVDIRRFISFGVLRNLIYRVHSFPVSDTISKSSTELQEVSNPKYDRDNSIIGEQDDKFETKKDLEMMKKMKHDEDLLVKSLAKMKHFDNICTDLQKGRKDIEQMLLKLGDWNVINS